MRRLFLMLICLLVPVVALAGEFVHPLEFSGEESEKAQVIRFIQANVKAQYSAIGMDDPLTLRMMEKEELKSFKALMNVKDRALLDRVIAQYCGIGMCNYNTILMMYKEQKKASGDALTW